MWIILHCMYSAILHIHIEMLGKLIFPRDLVSGKRYARLRLSVDYVDVINSVPTSLIMNIWETKQKQPSLDFV